MSAEPVADSVAVVPTLAGTASATFGFVLSTLKVTGSEVNGWLPARSVTTTRTWVGPSGEPTEFQWPVKGAAVEASTWTKLDEPTTFTSNDTPPSGISVVIHELSYGAVVSAALTAVQGPLVAPAHEPAGQ